MMTSKAEMVGIAFGRVWRSVTRREAYTKRWMLDRGVPPLLGSFLLWITKLAVLAALLYVAAWLALVVLVGAIAFAALRIGQTSQRPNWIDSHDHKQSLFYDPIVHNDNPDPRFDDE